MLEHLHQGCRYFRPEELDVGGALIFLDGRHCLGGRPLAEDGVAGQELEKAQAQGEDVSPSVDHTGELLGSQVTEFAFDQTGMGFADLGTSFGHAEVEQLDRAIAGQHDVGRADVTVHHMEWMPSAVDGPFVSIIQRFGDIVNDAYHEVERERGPFAGGALEQLAYGDSVDPLEDQIVATSGFTALEDGHDIGMTEARGDALLIDEHVYKKGNP